jgi:hypothetical protein
MYLCRPPADGKAVTSVSNKYQISCQARRCPTGLQDIWSVRVAVPKLVTTNSHLNTQKCAKSSMHTGCHAGPLAALCHYTIPCQPIKQGAVRHMSCCHPQHRWCCCCCCCRPLGCVLPLRGAAPHLLAHLALQPAPGPALLHMLTPCACLRHHLQQVPSCWACCLHWLHCWCPR